jgi:hypothetical protein
MDRGALFSYLAAFVTIVLALALTDMIQSVHRLLRARTRVKWDALVVFAASFVYVAILSEFFSLWMNLQVDRIGFAQLLWFMVPPVFITLASFACLPDAVPEAGLDLERFYFDNHRYLALTLGLAFVADLIRNLTMAGVSPFFSFAVVAPWFAESYLPSFVGIVLIWWAKDRRLQYLAYGLLLLAILTGIIELSIDLGPAAKGQAR